MLVFLLYLFVVFNGAAGLMGHPPVLLSGLLRLWRHWKTRGSSPLTTTPTTPRPVPSWAKPDNYEEAA